ncbi:hypothetical protein MG293_012662 [Ovis ammon polii]|uniref:Uncharacterized protein n=1 Tax=Ovis ammon polii TaxID=230172 RepID=A0AAD4U4Q0_OVIAM|nr:hypothetical protein MG293_012662 [Ovis ammon polii]
MFPPAVLLHSLRPLPTLPLLEEAPVFTAVIFMNSYMYCKLHVPQRSPPRPLKPPSKLPVNIMASIQDSHKMQQPFLCLLVPLLCYKAAALDIPGDSKIERESLGEALTLTIIPERQDKQSRDNAPHGEELLLFLDIAHHSINNSDKSIMIHLNSVTQVEVLLEVWHTYHPFRPTRARVPLQWLLTWDIEFGDAAPVFSMLEVRLSRHATGPTELERTQVSCLLSRSYELDILAKKAMVSEMKGNGKDPLFKRRTWMLYHVWCGSPSRRHGTWKTKDVFQVLSSRKEAQHKQSINPDFNRQFTSEDLMANNQLADVTINVRIRSASDQLKCSINRTASGSGLVIPPVI